MQRGFKAAAQRLAIEVRAEVSLDAYAALDPACIAQEYGVPVYAISELDAWGCAPSTLTHFAEDDRATFSAALIPVGQGRLIIENDSHAPTRRRASLAHELAHVLLEHPFGAAILTDDGCRAVAPDLEAEADCLGGELLVPSQAAKLWARRGMSDNDVAQRHAISLRYAAMRMNTSGARTIARRAAAKRSQ